PPGDPNLDRALEPPPASTQRTPGFVVKPARDGAVEGVIHDITLRQIDYTDEQYDALAHLVATLCEVLPRIECAAPTDDRGEVLTRTLDAGEFEAFRGVLGHFHVQRNKVDPGPAFDWARIIEAAARLRR
ncbi:MAG: N-acetylmuramoyl-L-alanine amidase, partial [Phycisphaerales bacterium]|nr:N-acetylmuramoyl-L-alanine amidase [Phycisphaerales bacterium]